MKEQMEHRQKGGRRGGALVLARWPWPIVRNVSPAVCVRRNHNNRAKPAERHFCSFVWFAPRLSNFGAFAEKSPMPWLHDSMALGLRGSTLGSWVRGRRVRRLVSGLETSEGQTPEAMHVATVVVVAVHWLRPIRAPIPIHQTCSSM